MRKAPKSTDSLKSYVVKQESPTFENVFVAVDKAVLLKEKSDMLIVIRDVLTADKISNPVEHSFALKRIEQLWGADKGTFLGRELNKLADIVCKYEEQILS
jgi:hypothetical protein